MKIRTIAIGIALLVGLVGAGAWIIQHETNLLKPQAPSNDFRLVTWKDLEPPNSQPPMRVRDSYGLLKDDDPKTAELMRDMQELLDNAPTVPELNDTAVKLAGYLVPLDESKGGLKEFLLVPYYGACVHTPPPPGNQIVHVFSSKPVQGFRSMDTVWVSGVIKTSRQKSAVGNSGYRLDAVAVTEYVR
jgi:uncharacterized protein